MPHFIEPRIGFCVWNFPGVTKMLINFWPCFLQLTCSEVSLYLGQTHPASCWRRTCRRYGLFSAKSDLYLVYTFISSKFSSLRIHVGEPVIYRPFYPLYMLYEALFLSTTGELNFDLLKVFEVKDRNGM